MFALVLLGLSIPGALVLHARLRSWAVPGVALAWDLAFACCMAASALHLVHLVRAQLRSPLFRIAVSIPGQTFVAAGFLAGLWQLALWPLRGALRLLELGAAERATRWLDLLPLALALISVGTSQRRLAEWVRVHLGPVRSDTARAPEQRESSAAHGLVRVRVERRRGPAPAASLRVLRVVQVSDTHLGPWQPVERLQRTLHELLACDPHLVLLTGDFLTMEGSGSPGALARALEPLRAVSERCFAVFGNHDHESPREVRDALRSIGVKLLVDEEAIAQTPVGPIQLLGADCVWRDREQQLQQLFRAYPRRAEHPRLLLLHDPSAYAHVPEGEVDLTFSGHTHGGQVGLVSLGFDWTVLRRSAWPDHGLFARGASLLYVHRGTGFYGFPLRIGVPGETSVLEVVLP